MRIFAKKVEDGDIFFQKLMGESQIRPLTNAEAEVLRDIARKKTAQKYFFSKVAFAMLAGVAGYKIYEDNKKGKGQKKAKK